MEHKRWESGVNRGTLLKTYLSPLIERGYRGILGDEYVDWWGMRVVFFCLLVPPATAEPVGTVTCLPDASLSNCSQREP